MSSEAQRRASAKYDAANTEMLHLKFNKRTDADILDKIHSVENKQAYVKGLIREDIDHK